MDFTKVSEFVSGTLGRPDRPATGRIHKDSEQVADVRCAVGRARLHGSGRRAAGGLGEVASDSRHDASKSCACKAARRSSSSTFPPRARPACGDDCVLLYGHLDKQPEMTGWSAHLGPWKPVIEGDRLYGRGGADDGYAIFGSLAAILALQEQGVAHSRCVVMIEACEESGSYDLPYYVDHLAARIGKPSLVVCLDSGCGNYEQMWLTTSLRGLTGGNLSVQVLDEGVHSGDASGVVASSFRILRQVLSRLEDEVTGKIKPQELYVEIPAQRIEQAQRTGAGARRCGVFQISRLWTACGRSRPT